ncbi:hypothetical protein [Bifidobacterium choerinum]|uniref:Uncharacterized protein n=1 Tax=Bifidobacterium choerinum TaxID=35760 RepID=A0A2D3D219_9BIFI|nr:hypothetical protein [Bifidobacterium choerinum]ATU19592.1 hypothetical protein BcFMB_00030 [Bifidobacterium choerinum]
MSDLTATEETLVSALTDADTSELTDEQRAEFLFAAQARRLATLKEQKKQIEEEIGELEQAIIAQHGEGVHKAGGYQVTVSNGIRTLDTRKFTSAFPPDRYPGLYETKPLAYGKASKLVGEPALAACVRTGKPQIRLKKSDKEDMWS